MLQYETIIKYPGLNTKILFGIILASCILLSLQVTAMADGPQNRQAEEAIQSDDLDSVILHLKWYHQFQFAGYYAAVEQGFFREVGLDVTMVEGSPGRNVIDEVLTGRAQYGVSNVDVLLNRLKGKPVVVLAAIFQHSPFILLSLKNSAIETPQDLIGRRVMLMKGVNNAAVLAMLHNEGLSIGQIRKIDTTFDINDLIDGKTDAFNAYITNEPYFLEKKGIPFSIIRPLTYGVDFYGDCLFTAERELKDNPGRVKRFREASLRGWEYAMQHPEEIIDVIMDKYSSKKSRDHLRFEAQKMRNLIMPKLVEMGHMNPGRWHHIADTLVQFEMADPEYFLKGFIYDPYPKPDYTRVRWIVGVALSISLLVGLSAVVLLIFNRRLQGEINERRQAEEALRESERRLKESQQIARIGQWELDLVNNQLYWSDGIYDIFEIDPDKFAASYEAFLNAIHPEDSEFVNKAYNESVKNKIPYDIVHRLLFKDGTTKYVNEICRTEYDKDGNAIRSIGTVQDITELKRAEEELKKHHEHLEELVEERTAELSIAKEQAETANRAKSVFLADMSHELRTPLNAILGFSQLMKRDPTVSQSHRENLDIVNRSGEHLLALINDVLDMSKIESGRITLNKESFDLHRILTVIEEMIRSRAGAKGLRFIVNRASDVPRYIRTDEQKLRQVLLNLLGNAVKFTEKGSITFRVRSIEDCRLKMEDGGFKEANRQSSPINRDFRYAPTIFNLQFEVQDTGIGIAPDEMETIFDPFVQQRSSRTPSEGTGLGLAISCKYVRLMGGDITVESSPSVPPASGGEEKGGKGSVFRFDIWIEPVEGSEVETEKPERRVIGLEPDQPEYRILVVEDNPENRLLLSQLLHSAGFEVNGATNGEKAIEQFKKWRPHLIWMDMRMPVMDGYEATWRIRELETRNLKQKEEEKSSGLSAISYQLSARPEHVPIVALTAYAFEGITDAISEAGCDDIVSRPFKEAEIFEVMEKHLGVRYVYEDSKEQLYEDILTPEALAELPDDLLAELNQAVIDLDVDLIQAVIERIRELNASVADGLAELAKDFQYDKLLALITQGEV